MRTGILHSLAKHFPRLHSIPIPEDINEVVVGLPSATVDQSAAGSCSKADLNAIMVSSEEVKDRLSSLAMTVSKNSFGKLDRDELVREWTDLLNFADISL